MTISAALPSSPPSLRLVHRRHHHLRHHLNGSSSLVALPTARFVLSYSSPPPARSVILPRRLHDHNSRTARRLTAFSSHRAHCFRRDPHHLRELVSICLPYSSHQLGDVCHTFDLLRRHHQRATPAVATTSSNSYIKSLPTASDCTIVTVTSSFFSLAIRCLIINGHRPHDSYTLGSPPTGDPPRRPSLPHARSISSSSSSRRAFRAAM